LGKEKAFQLLSCFVLRLFSTFRTAEEFIAFIGRPPKEEFLIAVIALHNPFS